MDVAAGDQRQAGTVEPVVERAARRGIDEAAGDLALAGD
jgi:hypothetical protein